MNFDKNDADIEKFHKSLSAAEKKEAVDTMYSLMAEGKAGAFKFVNGPHDGSEYLLALSKDGKPKRNMIYLSLNRIIETGKAYEAAEYKLNDKKKVFEYTGKTIMKEWVFEK